MILQYGMDDNAYRMLCAAILAQAGRDCKRGNEESAKWLVRYGVNLAKDCKMRLDCVGFVEEYFGVVKCESMVLVGDELPDRRE